MRGFQKRAQEGSMDVVAGVVEAFDFYGHWLRRNAPGPAAPGASSNYIGVFNHEKGDRQE